MARHWIGDAHLGHEKVAKIRGFKSTEEHDEVILAQLSEIPSEDTVHFMGDISSGRTEHAERALELISAFDFTKILLSGNHDEPSAIHKTGWKNQRHWLTVFDSVQDMGWFPMDGEMVMMSHYPYAAMGDGDGRSGPARYLPFRLPDVGNPLLHAHTHQEHPFSKMRKETITKIEFEGYDLNSMCTSWDARRGLTSESDVYEWLKVRNSLKKEAELEKVRRYWGSFPKPLAAG